MIKKISREPELFILLAGNALCIWYFAENKAGFSNIIWIYWCQSIIIGLFTFLELLTVRNFTAGNMRLNDQPVTKDNKSCAAWFFLLHYGIFHFVYMIFLAVKFHSSFNLLFIVLGVATFILESIFSFRRRKAIEEVISINIGAIFFLPYLRIIPMHLTILVPAFLEWDPSLVFLLLKTFADVIFYLVVRAVYLKPTKEQQ